MNEVCEEKVCECEQRDKKKLKHVLRCDVTQKDQRQRGDVFYSPVKKKIFSK